MKYTKEEYEDLRDHLEMAEADCNCNDGPGYETLAIANCLYVIASMMFHDIDPADVE